MYIDYSTVNYWYYSDFVIAIYWGLQAAHGKKRRSKNIKTSHLLKKKKTGKSTQDSSVQIRIFFFL